MATEAEAYQWVEEVFGDLLLDHAVQWRFDCRSRAAEIARDGGDPTAITAQYILWACLTAADRQTDNEWGSLLRHMTREDIVALREETSAVLQRPSPHRREGRVSSRGKAAACDF
jgi:hypothetical protein